MEIQENVCLKPYNTFGIAQKARYFVSVRSREELQQALSLKGYPAPFIISGGSNMLLTQDLEALVIHIDIQGIKILREDDSHVTIEVMAGENWHQLVLWTLDQGYGGLENLSLIPGKAGTAPIQNIGAYGVELKDCFVSCEALDMENLGFKTFDKESCAFGYRDSFFKNTGKGRYIITSIQLQLSKKDHVLRTDYGAIRAELELQGVSNPTIKDISNAVIAIRQRKLPDPAELGNSGSFFKNPVLSASDFNQFQQQYPEAPFYPLTDGSYKVPAGWLIEQVGFKGKRQGDAGVHKNQALVLVNYGEATGQEVLDLARSIQEEVWQTFQIAIVPEVNIVR